MTGRRWFTRAVLAAAVMAVMAAAGYLFLVLPGSGGGERVDFSQVAAPDAAGSRPRLRVAVAAMISPQRTWRSYGRLLRLIGGRLGREVEFVQRRTYAEVNELLAAGGVDVAFVCSGPYVDGHDSFGLRLVAVPVVDGGTVYHSCVIVRRNSPFRSLADLRGRRFAYTDPRSNSGYLLPRYLLLRQGEDPDRFFGDTFFTHSHDKSIEAVAEGQADGAAVDSLVYEWFKNTAPRFTGQTRIIARSPACGIPPIVARPDLPPELYRRIRALFLSLHRDREAAALMARLGIERFVPGDDAMYDSVREIKRALAGKSATAAGRAE